jgi:prepilin-type N-terminal cleavage/methylation domain-containing protein
MQRMYSSRRSGFTVPEILIAMAIASIILVGIMTLFVSLTGNSATTVKIADQIRNNDSAITNIENDLRLTKSFRATPLLADSNASVSPLQPDGWVYKGVDSTHRMLILQTYATSANPKTDGRDVVYRDDGLGGCPVGRDPVYNNIIYFVKDSVLYRRTLVEASPPTGTTYCGSTPTNSVATIAQKQTCANGQATGMPANCRERDVAIAKGITRFDIQYYEAAGSSTAISDIYTLDNTTANSTLSTAEAIRIDIATQGEPTENIEDLSSYRRLSKGATRGY